MTLSALVAGKEREWLGHIVRTDATIDPQTRTLSAIVEVADPYGAMVEVSGAPLAVGLFTEARIGGRMLEDVVVIPRTALRGSDKIFVVDDDSKLEIRNVEVATSNVNRAVISAGLAAGELVTDSPIDNARTGMLVTALSEAPQMQERIAQLIEVRDAELARQKQEAEALEAAEASEGDGEAGEERTDAPDPGMAVRDEASTDHASAEPALGLRSRDAEADAASAAEPGPATDGAGDQERAAMRSAEAKTGQGGQP